MDLTKANTVLAEIIGEFEDNNIEKPMIEIQKRNYDEHVVCIKNFLGTTRKQIVTNIAQKHNLKMSEESEGLLLS